MHHFDKIKVGEKLQTIRKEKKLVLRDLVCTELSLTTLSRIESGYPFISRAKYELFAEKLGETLDSIVRGESSEDIQRRRLKSKLVSIEHYIDFGKVHEALKELDALQLDSHHLYASTVHFLKGKGHVKAKKWKKAKKELLEAIRLAQANPQTDHLNIVAISYNYLSLVHFFEEEDSSTALECVDKALEFFIAGGDRSYLKDTFEVNRAFYLFNLQRSKESHDILIVLSKDDFQCIQMSSSKATACELLARIYLSEKKYQDALYYGFLGLEIGRYNQLLDQTFGLWNVLGRIQLETGEYAEAENSFSTALSFRGKLINDNLTSATFTEIGYLHIRQKNWHAAEQSILKAIEISQDTKGLRYIDALTALGDLRVGQKYHKKAINPYEKALFLARQHQLQQKEYTILIKLCNGWKLLDRDKYLNYLEQMHRVQIKLGLELQIPC